MRHAPTTLCLLGLGLAGCQPGELPGEEVGTYRIVGALMENSCGTGALPAQDPLEFRVQLRGEAGLGTWILDKPPGFSGTLDTDGAFLFQRQYPYVAIEPGAEEPAKPEEVADYLLPAPQPEPAIGCTLVIRETIDGQAHRTLQSPLDAGIDLDPTDAGSAGSPSADLFAENRIEIAIQPGSDCRKALSDQGGPFIELPCQARYELSGELTEAP